jgi:hypothetical protein
MAASPNVIQARIVWHCPHVARHNVAVTTRILLDPYLIRVHGCGPGEGREDQGHVSLAIFVGVGAGILIIAKRSGHPGDVFRKTMRLTVGGFDEVVAGHAELRHAPIEVRI